MRTLKVFLGWSRHELTNHPDRITKVWSGDSQAYEASDYVSEPRPIAYLSRVGAKLDGFIQRSRDGLTVNHPELVEHTQHIMPLVDQYAFGVADHVDLEEVMKTTNWAAVPVRYSSPRSLVPLTYRSIRCAHLRCSSVGRAMN